MLQFYLHAGCKFVHNLSMTIPPDFTTWAKWRSALQQWGLRSYIAILLDALGPLNVVGAQFLYLSRPFIPGTGRKNQWQALARLLEDREQRDLFTHFLQERDIL